MRLYLRSADRRPDPPPLRTDDRAAVGFGIAVWGVLLLVAIVLHDRLAEQGRGWWVWTPVTGILLGCYGLYYIRRRDEKLAARQRDGSGESTAPR